MSYDISLDRFSDEPPSGEQLEAAFKVLARYGAQPAARSNWHSVRWEDGTGLSMFSRCLTCPSVRFHALLEPLGDLSQRFCNFTYEFAAAVDCVIYPDVIPRFAIVVRQALAGRLRQAAWAKRVIQVSHGKELRDALTPSYYAWRGQIQDIARRLDEAFQGDAAGGP